MVRIVIEFIVLPYLDPGLLVAPGQQYLHLVLAAVDGDVVPELVSKLALVSGSREYHSPDRVSDIFDRNCGKDRKRKSS